MYRAICAKYGINEKSAEKVDSLELPPEMLSSPFAHIKEIRDFLLTLRHPTVSMAMFCTLAMGHIHEIRVSLCLSSLLSNHNIWRWSQRLNVFFVQNQTSIDIVVKAGLVETTSNGMNEALRGRCNRSPIA